MALTVFGAGARLTRALTPGVVIARKYGSPRMPASETAGMPRATTERTRSGCSSAMHSAHIAPSEVPTTVARSSPRASSIEPTWATACRRSERPL